MMMSRDTVCAICDRVVLGDEVDDRHCEECRGVICDEHSGELTGVHDPEYHIGPDDADGVEEPVEDR